VTTASEIQGRRKNSHVYLAVFLHKRKMKQTKPEETRTHNGTRARVVYDIFGGRKMAPAWQQR
jgi:hypothetical protein